MDSKATNTQYSPAEESEAAANDDTISSASPWVNGSFNFKVQLGEINLFERKLEGAVLEPNIFTYSAIEPKVLAANSTTESVPAHLISVPCTEQTEKGIKTGNRKIVYTYKTFRRMYVDVSGGHQEYLDGFNKKSLSGLNRKIKKVEKSNKDIAALRVFSNAAEVEEFVKIAKAISKVSYQELLLGTVFRTDQEWVNDLEELAKMNRFRGYVLYVEDTAVAYNYCPVYGDGVMLYDLSGYNPDYQKFSPGTVLQYHVIKQAFAEPSIAFYDLCQGEGRHKEQFSTGSIKCCNAFLMPNSIYYWLHVGLHYVIESTSDRVVSVLDRFGLKDRIKTYIRRR